MRPLILLVAAIVSACSPNGERQMLAHELGLATIGNSAFAAWHGGPLGRSSIYLQKLDDAGELTGEPSKIQHGDGLAYEPDLIAVDKGLAVAWYERSPKDGKLTAWLAGVSEDGRRDWIVQLSGQGPDARNPVIRPIGTEIHVAWIEQGQTQDAYGASIWFQRFSQDGRALSAAVRLADANRETWNLNAGVDGNALYLVYDAALGTVAHELHMIAIREGSVTHQGISEDDGHASLYPDLQFSKSGRAALTWFDARDGNQEVYLMVGDPEDLTPHSASKAQRITYSPGASSGAYVAWNADEVGLAWVDEIEGQPQLFAQLFTAEGGALGPASLLSTGPNQAGVPVIRAYRDGFVVAWNDYVLGGVKGHLNVVSSGPRIEHLTGFNEVSDKVQPTGGGGGWGN